MSERPITFDITIDSNVFIDIYKDSNFGYFIVRDEVT